MIGRVLCFLGRHKWRFRKETHGYMRWMWVRICVRPKCLAREVA